MKNKNSIRLYSLLYVDHRQRVHANIKWTFSDAVDIYISCAALAANSAGINDIDFSLITNDTALIENRLRALRLPDISTNNLQFTLSVPYSIDFHNAHFKLDAIKALASGQFGDLVGLIDVDVIFNHKIPDDVKDVCHSDFAVYDISEQIYTTYGFKKIQSDLELIAGCKFDNPRWFGGEFLIASAPNMGILSNEISTCWLRYINNLDRVTHVGDEMIVSAALNLLARRGFPITDIGTRGVVARWWTSRTGFRQPTFEEIEQSAILHLPADKPFLAKQARRPFTRDAFLKTYKTYAKRKLRMRKAYNFIKAKISGEKKFVGVIH